MALSESLKLNPKTENEIKLEATLKLVHKYIEMSYTDTSGHYLAVAKLTIEKTLKP